MQNQIKRNLFQFLKKEGVQIQNNNYIKALNEKNQHNPVMLDNIIQIIKSFKKDQNQYMLDCTLGCGGHSLNALKQFQNLNIVGLDLDQRMIQNMHRILDLEDKQVSDRLKPININFKDMDSIDLNELFQFEDIIQKKFDFILADLGYSSYHLTNADWGFSYMDDGDLDMRFQPGLNQITAKKILNEYDAISIQEIFQNYGDLKYAKNLAKIIIEQRKIEKFQSTTQLRNLILHSDKLDKKFNTLVKIFQALRIAVNDELNNLSYLMHNIPKQLNKGGVAMIITFHSLEEDIVISNLGHLKRNKQIQIIQKKVQPNQQEIDENVRSRSAKLFYFQKI